MTSNDNHQRTDTIFFPHLYSSWNFDKIIQYHCRHVVGSPSNILKYSKTQPLGDHFIKPVKEIFKNSVYDPNSFPPESPMNICVPKAIACTMILRSTQTTNTKTVMTEVLNQLNYHHLLDVFPSGGIPVS